MAEANNTTTFEDTSERLENLQNLHYEIQQIQKENRRNDEAMDRVEEIIQETSRITEQSDQPHEMILDAKILHIGAQVVSSSVSAFQTNLTAFNEDEYEQNLLLSLETMSHDNRIVSSAWEAFTDATYHLFKRVNPITYMLGTFDLEPPPKKEKKKAERLKKGPEAEKKTLATYDNKENAVEEESSIYELIYACLGKCYKKNNRQPVSYIKFVIDPTNYWKTVENIFYFSFLVRDDLVKMTFDNNKLPMVEPLVKTDKNKKSGSKNQQFCFRLSQSEWKDCINTFNITSASIPPFNNQNRS